MSGGWESGSCAAPRYPLDDAPEWPELLAALNARVDRLLDAKRADAGHAGECSAL